MRLLLSLFSAASQKHDVGKEGEGNARNGVDLGAGWCGKGPLIADW